MRCAAQTASTQAAFSCRRLPKDAKVFKPRKMSFLALGNPSHLKKKAPRDINKLFVLIQLKIIAIIMLFETMSAQFNEQPPLQAGLVT